MKSYWLSWTTTPLCPRGSFELHSPWWTSGEGDGPGDFVHHTICATVRAESEGAAKTIVMLAHDNIEPDIEWRFCSEKPDDWSPFAGGRFPRAPWMVWP